jgi:transcriptional regulator with XRE-family HTH domain
MASIQKMVGQNIRLFRRAKGITQEVLAEMVDVSGSYIGYLERGKKSPSLDLLVKIADVLSVEPAILFTPAEETVTREFKKLIGILSGKGTEPLRFMNKVAEAYFQSLETS